jgi:hypothetical protein
MGRLSLPLWPRTKNVNKLTYVRIRGHYNQAMKFQLEPNQLTIKLEGAEQLWALKRRLQIPAYAIFEVDYLTHVPSMTDYRNFFRFPGTAIPWRFLAGSYVTKGKREFWYIKMQQPGVLILTLKPETLKYTKVRITCSPEIAQDVADWWQEHK